jgi:hypothetical protein
MTSIKLPDITLAQILAGVSFIVGQAVTMGLADSETSKFILSLATTVITAAWVVGDAVIRHGRSKIAAAAITAGTAPPVSNTRV